MSVQYKLNKELAQMLKGGVIMDVTTPEQAKIAEAAGACAVMALERIPADIRAAGGVSRMSDPAMIKGIQEAVSIPVMAKVRIGHIAEARILQAIEIDYIDESEVLSPADDVYHIDKREFDVPFVCGAKNLGEALRRIEEGASMIRTKGEPGTGDVIQAVRHMRTMTKQIRELASLRDDEVYEAAKQLAVPYELAKYVHDNGRLPVVNFAAGGVATPADAALMMELGAEGVFVGSGIFKSGDPAKRAAAIVQAREVLGATRDPQRSDLILDKAYFQELEHLAHESRSDFLKGYVQMLVDAANLRSVVRVLRMGRDADYLATVLFPGGSVSEARVLKAADGEALESVYFATPLEAAAAAGQIAVQGDGLTGFEKACDDAVNAYMQQAKYVAFGEQPLLGYVSAKDNEFTAIRIIMTGRLADLPADVIRERLRNAYV